MGEALTRGSLMAVLDSSYIFEPVPSSSNGLWVRRTRGFSLSRQTPIGNGIGKLWDFSPSSSVSGVPGSPGVMENLDTVGGFNEDSENILFMAQTRRAWSGKRIERQVEIDAVGVSQAFCKRPFAPRSTARIAKEGLRARADRATL